MMVRLILSPQTDVDIHRSMHGDPENVEDRQIRVNYFT